MSFESYRAERLIDALRRVCAAGSLLSCLVLALACAPNAPVENPGAVAGPAQSGSAGGNDGAGASPGAVSPVEDGELLWFAPREGLVWERSRLLASLAVPLSSDPRRVRIMLNGQDITGRFHPAGFFSERWASRMIARDRGTGVLSRAATGPESPDVTAAGQEAGEEGADGLWVREGAGYVTARRMLATLGPDDLERGENLLEAWFGQAATDQSDSPRAGPSYRRTFEWQPKGRPVRFRLVRLSGGERDERASGRILLSPERGAPPCDFRPFPAAVTGPAAVQPPQNFVFVRGGETTFFLPAGTYRAVATGGLLDGIDEWTVPARGRVEHTFVIRREIDITGSATADFHVHSAASPDSNVPLEDRVWSYLAGGVDVMVGTDHGIVADYGPVIARMPASVRTQIRAVSGIEATFRQVDGPSIGHWNIWPLSPDQDAAQARPGKPGGHGARGVSDVPLRTPGDKARWVAEAYDAFADASRVGVQAAGNGRGARVPSQSPVIQLSHPRGTQVAHGGRFKRSHDWFNVAGFNPEIPLRPRRVGAQVHPLLETSKRGTSSLDFDAIELWNRSSLGLYLEVRRDWFSLLNQGFVRTAVANTDTHREAFRLAGYPLNVVSLSPGQPDGARVLVEDLASAVRAGRVVGSDGPVPRLTVTSSDATAGPGGLLAASSGRVRIRVEVQAAGWVPAGPVRVWSNGRVIGRSAVEPAGPGASEKSRSSAGAVLELSHTFERDAWILAEAGDDARDPGRGPYPGLYGRIVPTGLALGFTNPVLVDVDGNGRFDAPGLDAASLP